MSENVIPLTRPAPEPSPVPEDLREVVTSLLNTIAEMDVGMKALVEIIAKHDVQIRKLELAQRKADRKNVPVIVNQHGERAN